MAVTGTPEYAEWGDTARPHLWMSLQPDTQHDRRKLDQYRLRQSHPTS